MTYVIYATYWNLSLSIPPGENYRALKQSKGYIYTYRYSMSNLTAETPKHSKDDGEVADVDMTADEQPTTIASTNGERAAAAEGEEEDEEVELDTEKIKILPQATSEDGTSASFRIIDEDHTLGNALRYIIMKNPQVEFCGYSIPHPSENVLNIRIQTYGEITAVDALKKGLNDLIDLCNVVEDTFTRKIKEM